MKRGAFSLSGRAPQKPDNAAYRIGLFNETVPRFLEEHRDPISLAHVDCDLYSSAVYVLRQCLPRFQNGTVLVFDELVNYRRFDRGELLALYDALQGRGISVRVIGHAIQHIHAHPKKETWPQAVAIQLVM